MDATTIRDLFARHDLRWTKQREEVYAALAAGNSHPTAEELFRLVHASGPESDSGGISLATVYNTLEALVRCGLARRFPAGGSAGDGVPGGSAGWCHRYDADVTPHAHVVLADGRIRDVPPDIGRRVMEAIPPEVIAELDARLGLTIERVSVQFVEAAREHPPSA